MKKNIQYYKSDKQNIDNSVILIIKNKTDYYHCLQVFTKYIPKRSWSQMEYLRNMFISCPSATGPQHSAIPRGNPPTHRLPAFPGLGKCRIKKTPAMLFHSLMHTHFTIPSLNRTNLLKANTDNNIYIYKTSTLVSSNTSIWCDIDKCMYNKDARNQRLP